MMSAGVEQQSPGERMIVTVAEIVHHLIDAQENGRDINLNKYDKLQQCIDTAWHLRFRKETIA